jgi:hypothetical protein
MKNSAEPAETRKVRVFFYGSFIDRDVLARVHYHPDKMEVARLDGFDITMRPLATLIQYDGRCVYGVLANATHAELQRLYGEDWVRAYLPEAVVVTTQDGAFHPALCYIARSKTAEAPFDNYIERIIESARKSGFPKWYIERLECFRVP